MPKNWNNPIPFGYWRCISCVQNLNSIRLWALPYCDCDFYEHTVAIFNFQIMLGSINSSLNISAIYSRSTKRAECKTQKSPPKSLYHLTVLYLLVYTVDSYVCSLRYRVTECYAMEALHICFLFWHHSHKAL